MILVPGVISLFGMRLRFGSLVFTLLSVCLAWIGDFGIWGFCGFGFVILVSFVERWDVWNGIGQGFGGLGFQSNPFCLGCSFRVW